MNTVTLPTKIYTPLQKVAQKQGKQVDNIIEDLVEEFLQDYRSQQLLEEMDRYRTQHPVLVQQYDGQFIGLYDGQILGHGDDGGQLYYRLRQEYGDLPILIVEVTETPEQEFVIHTPNLDPSP